VPATSSLNKTERIRSRLVESFPPPHGPIDQGSDIASLQADSEFRPQGFRELIDVERLAVLSKNGFDHLGLRQPSLLESRTGCGAAFANNPLGGPQHVNLPLQGSQLPLLLPENLFQALHRFPSIGIIQEIPEGPAEPGSIRRLAVARTQSAIRGSGSSPTGLIT
jgi:hypothetical protein